MIVATIHEVPGRRIERILGIARGTSIRGRAFGTNVLAWFRTLVGGEITDMTKVIAEAREQALDRAIEDARRMGADALLGVRYTTTEVLSNAAEFVVYGTAVVLADES